MHWIGQEWSMQKQTQVKKKKDKAWDVDILLRIKAESASREVVCGNLSTDCTSWALHTTECHIRRTRSIQAALFQNAAFLLKA